MRILMLSDRIPPENKGGAEKVTWALARGLRDAGHEIHVIAATEGDAFEEVREGIPTYHLRVRYPSRFNAYFALYNPQVNKPLRDLYTRIQPDVVHAFNIHADLTYNSLRIAHQMRFPVVFMSQDVMAFSYTKLTHYINPAVCGVTSPEQYRLPPLHSLRTMRFRYNPLRNPFIRHVLNTSASVRIAGSEAHRQSLTANGLDGFQVIYGSVAPEDWHASETTITNLRQRLDLTGRKVILFAGRLTPDKGSRQVLAMLSETVKRVPNAVLLVLTRASLESQGLAEPEFQHLREYVKVGGWLQGEDLAAAYHLSDVVIVPSICMDTFPTINLEAMAAGKPVVATCYGGSPEAILDGETGYIVNPFDTAQFAARVGDVLSDDGRAKAMGAAGHARLMAHFSLARQVREMEAAYRQAIARPSHG